MEDWEKELKDKLEKELPDGLYQIGASPYLITTGKSGHINFEIALRKAAENFKPYNNGEWINYKEWQCFHDRNKCKDCDDIIESMKDGI